MSGYFLFFEISQPMSNPLPLLIAFDVDKTLVFGPEADQFYRLYYLAIERAFAVCAGISLSESKAQLDAFRADNNGRGELAFPAEGYALDNVYDAICSVDPTGLPRMEKTIATLTALQKRATLIAITDGPDLQAERLFTATGIDPSLFTEIICWQRGAPMPKGGRDEVFTALSQRYGIHPSQILMVGDALEIDILPARRAGLSAMLIGDGPDAIPDITSLISLYDNTTTNLD